MSIARLKRHQGKREEARGLLELAYGRFTEGFDTADLKRAKQLLSELGERQSGRPARRKPASARPIEDSSTGTTATIASCLTATNRYLHDLTSSRADGGVRRRCADARDYPSPFPSLLRPVRLPGPAARFGLPWREGLSDRAKE